MAKIKSSSESNKLSFGTKKSGIYRDWESLNKNGRNI